MEGESGEQVEDDLESVTYVISRCKADGMRQEVDPRDEVT